MGRFIYRMCLIVVLAIAVAGGVYYYTTFYQTEEGPQKGTFVNRMDHSSPEPDGGLYGMITKKLHKTMAKPLMQTGQQFFETAHTKGQ